MSILLPNILAGLFSMIFVNHGLDPLSKRGETGIFYKLVEITENGSKHGNIVRAFKKLRRTTTGKKQ